MSRFRSALRRLLLPAFLVAAALVFGGWYVTSCGEYPPEPAASCDPPAGQACASAGDHCWNRKDNLANVNKIYLSDVPVLGSFLVAKQIVRTDWGYVKTGGCGQPNGYIRWRNSTHHFEPHAPVGTAWDGGSYWHTSYCYDNQDRCLTRLNARTGYTLPSLGINFHDESCIATRIGYGGDHHRIVHETRCDDIAQAALGANSGYAAALRQWERDHYIEDFVSPLWAKKIHAACFGPLAQAALRRGTIPGYCRRMLLRAWDTLSPEEQRRAARLMAETRRRYVR